MLAALGESSCLGVGQDLLIPLGKWAHCTSSNLKGDEVSVRAE